MAAAAAVMTSTAEEWFDGIVKPEAPVAEYMSAPPRGMTNAPQNPKVRAALLKDLNDWGVPLQAEVWPPPRPSRAAPPGPGALEMRWRTGTMRRTPSCPAVFGGTSLRAPPTAAGFSRSASPRHSPAGAKARPTVDKKPKKWIYSAELDKHEKEYEVLLERSGSKKIGITEFAGELVAVPEDGTLMDRWNRENPELVVKHGDRIVEVNGVRDSVVKMTKQFRKAESWDVRLRRAWDAEADVLSQSQGSPTARWRNRVPFQFEGEALGAAPRGQLLHSASDASLGKSVASGGGAGAAAAAGSEKDSSRGGAALKASGARGTDGKKGREKGEGQEAWQHPDQQKINDRVMTEQELQNARLYLRGQAGLHSAAMSDCFRFAADISRGAPLCIRGSGTACGTASDIWASDGAALVAFHNGALRGVNPSPLQPVPEPPPEQKKRRKGGDDDLGLGDSGLFKPLYPLDASLRSLRKLKRQAFPEACRREEELIRQRKELEVAETVKAVVEGLNLLSGLSKRQSPVGDEASQAL